VVDSIPLGNLLRAVAALTLLTQLDVAPLFGQWQQRGPQPPAAAFTALTASSRLCFLKLHLPSNETPADWVLFKPHQMYPHMRTIEGSVGFKSCAKPLSEQQVRRLCRCCPALESLSLAMGDEHNLFGPDVWSG
jgi:hypothetical protein